MATEVMIKVLLKTKSAMEGLLKSPNEADFSEIFFRSSFLRSYEDTLHEIVQNSDNEIFY